MWTKKKESDILSQMASDARVSDAAKCEIKPVLQPQARKNRCENRKNAAEERQFQQRQSKTLHLHNTRKEAGSQ